VYNYRMEALIKYLAGEGRVVLQAPVALLIVCISVFGIAYAIMNWKYTSQIEIYQTRLALKDETIANYKEKLNGATPDEAKKRLEALEALVKTISPRRLSDDQKKIITKLISNTKGVISITHDAGAADAKVFAYDLANIFRSCGWEVRLPMVIGLGYPPPRGVALQIRNESSLTETETIVKTALERALIDFNLQAGWTDFGGGISTVADVGILVTTRID
jgi:hypothetical protein